MVLNVDHPHRREGVLVLMLATFLWGTTFVVTKRTLGQFPAGPLVFGRFLVAGIVFLPFLRTGWKLWRGAIELGILLWLGFSTQTIGLEYTTINRSAFITALQVIIVPVLVGLVGRRSRPIIWVAASLALLGVGLMSHDGSAPNRGDAWTVLCAFVWAVYITRLELWTARLPSRPLTAAHIWVVVILAGAWTGIAHPHTGSIPWAAIIYLGLIATAITTWLQTLGQKWVSAPQAVVLYTMEPLWAGVFGWLVLKEKPGALGWVGAALILLAALLTQIPAKKAPK